MATKEQAGIRKLAETLQLISTKGLAGTEQFSETEAELKRVLGPLLRLLERSEGNPPWDELHTDIAAALEKFNRGE